MLVPLAALLVIPAAVADSWLGTDRGKLLLTAGFSSVEGSGGGGLSPWALITGYGSDRSWGANGHATAIALRDFDFRSYGVAAGVFDRFEASVSRQTLDGTRGALDGVSFSQDILGVKLRLFGDAVYAQDSWLPQVAVGAQAKRHRGIEGGAAIGNPALRNVTQLGARDEDGVDYYLTATKISFADNLLLSATLRYTRANQFGLLGFGGDREEGANLQAEGTIAYVMRRTLAVGVEYRTRARHLGIDDEGDAWDAFLAWAPSRHISVVAAYVNLGNVAAPVSGESTDQDGAYLSVQVGF
jgi:hypothetical protein